MPKRKKIGESPLSQNLYRILQSGQGMEKNLDLIEKETGLAKSTIRNWILGVRQAQLGNLQKIAEVLKVDVYSFFDNPKLTTEQKELYEMIQRIDDPDILAALKSVARAGIIKKSQK